MSTSLTLERFDGEAAWRLLSPEDQLRIGAIAMELGANFRLQDLILEGKLDQRFDRVAGAADTALIGLLTQAVDDVLPEGAFLAPDGRSPRIPYLLGGVCRACGCSQNDACDEGCGWAGVDLCTACVGGGEPHAG